MHIILRVTFYHTIHGDGEKFGVAVNPVNEAFPEWRVFTIQDLQTNPNVEKYRVREDSFVRDFMADWPTRGGYAPNKIQMWVDTKPLNPNVRVCDAQIYEGAVIYAESRTK